MKIERTKNASRNVFFGIILKIYQILIPFVMRTIMIYFMGVQYLGLNSLFSSILQVLNLAELGVGSAMVYSMYKPIAEDDSRTICALMRLYHIYYRVIGGVIAFLGIILIPFIPKLIKGEIPSDINVYILYLINLAATVLSYWLFAYKNCLLQAHQRNDVVSKVTLITNTMQYLLQVLVLCILQNYYLYVIVALATQAVTNIVTACVVNKMYPEYKEGGTLSKNVIRDINQRIKDLFTAKLGVVIVGSADTIVISWALGLTILAIYQNYYFIMNSICGVITVLFTSVTAGIGNSLVIESKQKNYNDFEKFTFIICWIMCICCCCFIGLYQPFMNIWVGNKLMLSFDYVILFCIYFYVLELAMVWATVKDAAGLWHADRYRPLIGAIVNLVLNIILVKYIGLYGILLSTIISYVGVSMPWLVYNIFNSLYEENAWKYIKKIIIYVFITIIACTLCAIICENISIKGVSGLVTKLIICLGISNLIQFLILNNRKEYIESKNTVFRIIKKGR